MLCNTKNGEFYTQKHEYGKGFYLSSVESIAKKYNAGYIMQIQLHKDAKGIEWYKIKQEIIDKKLKIDVGDYAKQLGYDYLKIGGTKYTLVVNRKMTIIKKVKIKKDN